MKGVESLYYKLFSIPRKEITLTVSFFTALILSLLDFRLIYLWLAVFLTSLTAVIVLALRFDLKRISFLAALLTVLTTPAILLNGSIAATSFLLFLTFYFCSDRKILSFPFAALPYLALSTDSATVVTLILSASLVLLYLKILDTRVGVLRIRRFVESFVLFWLTNKAEYMERFLESFSEEFDGKVRCLKINDFKLIHTDFHPGPFRNVGGAKLVEVLSKNNAVYLHSPTSHKRNPVSLREVEKIASALRCSGKKLKPFKPFKVEGNNFEAFCFPFDGQRIIFVSGKKRIDDFIIQTESLVVDCHNAFEADYDVAEEEVREIAELVSKAENSVPTEVEEVRAAFVKIEAKTESICNYAASVLLEYDGERYALIVFDSNNVELKFRREVEKLFAEHGYIPIVASTDNHSKTGIRARQSYKPAGADPRDWEVVNELLEKCKRAEVSTADFEYSESRVKAKVMGSEVLRNAELAVNEKAKQLIATFLGFTVLSYLIGIAL